MKPSPGRWGTHKKPYVAEAGVAEASGGKGGRVTDQAVVAEAPGHDCMVWQSMPIGFVLTARLETCENVVRVGLAFFWPRWPAGPGLGPRLRSTAQVRKK